MLIRMFQIEVSKIDMLLKRFNWGGTELLTLSLMHFEQDKGLKPHFGPFLALNGPF